MSQFNREPMSAFTDSIKFTLSQYAVFQGRATRREFWYFILFSWLAQSGGDILDLFLPGAIIANLIALVLFIPSLTVAIRRVRDTGRSPWFLLIPFYNLYLLVQPSAAPNSNDPNNFNWSGR